MRYYPVRVESGPRYDCVRSGVPQLTLFASTPVLACDLRVARLFFLAAAMPSPGRWRRPGPERLPGITAVGLRLLCKALVFLTRARRRELPARTHVAYPARTLPPGLPGY